MSTKSDQLSSRVKRQIVVLKSSLHGPDREIIRDALEIFAQRHPNEEASDAQLLGCLYEASQKKWARRNSATLCFQEDAFSAEDAEELVAEGQRRGDNNFGHFTMPLRAIPLAE